jgi:hypothetical protein
MRILISGIILTGLQFFLGCANQGRALQRSDLIDSEAETITYNWRAYRLEVSFYKPTYGGPWYMAVRDSWDVLDQSSQQNKIWSQTDSRCSAKDALRIVDQSMTRFQAIRPKGKLESVHIEMQVVGDLWQEVLASLATTMPKLEGKKEPTFREGPPELIRQLRAIVDRSAVAADLRQVFANHGHKVVYVTTSEQVLFKDSLADMSWREIGNRPDLGILAPGMVEFGLTGVR